MPPFWKTAIVTSGPMPNSWFFPYKLRAWSAVSGRSAPLSSDSFVLHVNAPDKPFFLYHATGAAHAPHQVRKEWIAKYKGKFDMGWDSTARLSSRIKRSWGSYQPTPSSRVTTRTCRFGTR